MINAYAAGNVGTGQSYPGAGASLGGLGGVGSMNFNNDALNQRIPEMQQQNALGSDTLGRVTSVQGSSSINRNELIRVQEQEIQDDGQERAGDEA